MLPASVKDNDHHRTFKCLYCHYFSLCNLTDSLVYLTLVDNAKLT